MERNAFLAEMNHNIASIIYGQALRRPNRAAMIIGSKVITYAKLARIVSIVARHFRVHGIKPGQVVGVTMDNNPMHLFVILALAQIGAVSLPLHPAIPVDRRQLAAQRFRAEWVVSGRSDRALDGLPFIGIDGILFGAGQPGDESIHAVSEDDPMRIIISSGTSGDPKGMALSHKTMSLRNHTTEAGMTPTSRVLPLDLNFIAGFRPAMSALAMGATLVFPPTFGIQDILKCLIRQAVTHTYLSPLQAKDIAALVRASSPACPNLVCLRIGGGPINPSLLQKVKAKLSNNVYISYGSTESGLVSYATPDMLSRYPDTVGRVREWATVEVIDQEGQALPSGVIGQLRIKSSHQVTGYYLDEERNHLHFRKGWFHPGDLGYFNDEGLLFIKGRVDEQFNIGGSKVNTEDIEATLATHPAVTDIGAFVATAENGNECLAVAVVLSDQARLDEVRVYGQAKLGPLAPTLYFIALSLPRTETGKLKRNELAGLFA